MRSLSGRWPNPYSAVSGWYVCCVLNIWCFFLFFFSLPCLAMISTAPIDWRRFSAQNAPLFELQNLCIVSRIGLGAFACHRDTHTCKHTNGQKKKALFHAILRMTQYALCAAQKEIKRQINELVLYVQYLASSSVLSGKKCSSSFSFLLDSEAFHMPQNHF